MSSNLAHPIGTVRLATRLASAGRITILFVWLANCVAAFAQVAHLRAEADQGALKLSWDLAGAKLQRASNLAGPWDTVTTAAASPYHAPSSGRQGFLRLVMPAPGKKWLTVAVVTMASVTNTEANLQTFFSYMEAAASNRADLIVFPEVALQGCPGWREDAIRPSETEMAYTLDTAEPVPGPSTERLVAKARELGVYVVFGLTEKSADGKLYNASVFLGPQGVLGTHRKSVAVGNDGLIWSRGTNLIQVVATPLGNAGMLICAETGGEHGIPATYPGPRLAAAGADFIVTASAWWTRAAFLWNDATCTNALWARCWHFAAEQTGLIGHAQCYGHARIVDPNGRVIAESGTSPGLLVSTTDIQIDIPPGSWSQGKAMPAPASTCASCVLDGILYVMGGHDTQDGTNALRAVWAYDPGTDSWTRKADLPEARHFLGQSAAAVDGLIYLVGGSGPGVPGALVRPVAVYDPKSDTWTNGAPMPTGRGNLAACAVDGIIYAIAGTTGPGSQLDTVEAYDPKSDRWTSRRSMPEKRWFVTAAAVNGFIYVFHGTDTFVYDPETDQWAKRTSSFSPYSWGLMSAEVNGTIYLFGGFTEDWRDGNTFALAYDPQLDRFTAKREMPRPRATAACGAIAGKVLLAGGASKEPLVNPTATYYTVLDVFDPQARP